jgi:hypothetical protein
MIDNMKQSKETQQPLLEDLTKLSGWAKLPNAEQEAIKETTTKTAIALHDVSMARIAVGKQLLAARTVLEPKRIFTKWLKLMFHMSKATAYRYIGLYEAAESKLSAPVLECWKWQCCGLTTT